MTILNRNNTPKFISGLTFAFATVLAGFAALEFVLLEENDRPITWYTRNLTSNYPKVAIPILMSASFVTGLLAAHFAWDVEDHP